MLTIFLVPQNVPLTIIKGAGHEFIPIPQGESAIVADFHSYVAHFFIFHRTYPLIPSTCFIQLISHSIRTQTTDSPAYLTSGFYKIQAGPTRDIPQYTYEETKYVLSGQIDVLDEATGITHHLVAGDFAFFHVGSKAKFSTKSNGLAFFAVTRAIITQHPNLKGREEEVKSKL
jgi:uncharacterized cupin superfamily protein